LAPFSLIHAKITNKETFDMKKGMVLGALLTVMVVVLALGVFSFASAQTPIPPTTPFGRGGMMGGMGYGRGMMGGARGQGMLGGAMHPYMVKYAAEALDMTEVALNTELAAGKTLWQVAEAQGLNAEDIQAVMQDVHTKALAQMVADGLLTQAQADTMQSRMGGMWGQGGMGAGCPMGGGRWTTQPAQPTTGG
jgi:hypothetical protein